MRKLILQEWISLDGFAADHAGSTAFFDQSNDDKASEQDLLAFVDTVDTILLGANTYRMFSAFWPTADPKEQVMASRINTLPKLVFSKTLHTAPWGTWPQAMVVKTDLIDTVKNLREQSGKNLVLWGSVSIAQSLIRAGLIDEYHIRVVPILLGNGLPLFSPHETTQSLELLESKTYESGITLLRYAPVERG